MQSLESDQNWTLINLFWKLKSVSKNYYLYHYGVAQNTVE